MELHRRQLSTLEYHLLEETQRSSPLQLLTGPAARRLFYHGALCFVALVASLMFAGPLTAQGTLTATPSEVDFGVLAVGLHSSQAIQLRNSGSSLATISGAMVVGAAYSLGGVTFPQTIAPGSSLNLTVVFGPFAHAALAGRISIYVSGSAVPLAINLIGEGESALPTVTVSTGSLSFGNILAGTSNSQLVTVTNSGNANVAIAGASVSGTAFTVAEGLTGATLSPGQSTDVHVNFAPQTGGSQSGTISIASNAVNSPNLIRVSGAGVSSTDHCVTLNWSPTTTDAVSGYNVYRSIEATGSYAKLNQEPTVLTQFADGNISDGATYFYVVTAVNLEGEESEFSDPVPATIP